MQIRPKISQAKQRLKITDKPSFRKAQKSPLKLRR